MANAWFVLIAQLRDDLKVQVIAGAGALIVVVSSMLLFAARNARINRQRRVSGRGKLSWQHIAKTRMSPKELAGAATDHEIGDALELARQIEWEREQAAYEMAKYGRSQVRGYCATHDRWCKYPERGPHPPGGHDNETAPSSWRPVGEGPPPTG